MKQHTFKHHVLSLAVTSAMFASGSALAALPVVADGVHLDIANDTYDGAPGYRGHAVQAINGGSVDADQVTLATTGDEANGANATGAGSLINLTNATVSTSGYVSAGLAANAAGVINASGVSIVTTGANGRGFVASAEGSVVNFNGGSVITTNTSADGLRASGNGVINVGRDANGNGTVIDVRGAAVGAIVGSVSDAGASGAVSFDGTTVQAARGQGVWVGGSGAQATMSDSVIRTRSVGLTAINDGRTDLVDTTIETAGSAAHGISASMGGKVSALRVDVTTQGSGAATLLANGAGSSISHDGGTLKSYGSMGNTASPDRLATVTAQDDATIVLDNVRIENLYTNTVSGPEGAIPDVRLGMGILADGANVSVSNSSIQAQEGVTALEGSHVAVANTVIEALGGRGLLVGDGATATVQGGSILVRQSAVTPNTPSSHATGVWASTGGHASLADTTIEVQQRGAIGLLAYSAGSQIDMAGGSVLMTADDAYGVVAGYAGYLPVLRDGTVNLTSTDIEVRGANSVGLLAEHDGAINATDTRVLTHGTGSHAAIVEDGTLTSSGGMLAATGSDSSSLVVKAGGNAALTDSLVSADQSAAMQVDGDATIDLNGAKAWSGAGLLLVSDDSASAIGSGTVNFSAAASELYGDILFSDGYTSNLIFSEGTLLRGAAQYVDDLQLSDSRWDMTGDSLVGNLSARSSTIAFNHDDGAFKTLTVTGDYVGDNALLQMNTVLGDDNSSTDRLHVLGNTAGQTGIAVNNIGGAGALTHDGIQLVQVDGASNGSFSLVGRAVGGAYEYFLHKGGVTDPTDGDWYLRSALPVDPPVDPGTDPVVVTPPVDPDPCFSLACVDPEGPSPSLIQRPETGAYLANQAAAVGMFDMTLHERLGEPNLAQRLKSDDTLNSAWLRTTSDHTRFNAGQGQLDVTSHQSMLQVGTDFAKWGDDSRGLAGIMLATGKSTTQSTSNLTGYGARGTVDGNALGLYATWFQSPTEQTGAYVDAWVQASRFKNTVQGDALARERYDSKATTASLEAGYAFKVREGVNSALYVEPQAQVTWTDFSMDDHAESNGTQVRSIDAGGLQTRLGVRVYGHNTAISGNRVQPFVGINWIRTHGEGNSLALDETYVAGGQPRNTYQAKAGAQLQLGGGWTGWGELSSTRGKGSYSNYGGQMGVKYSW